MPPNSKTGFSLSRRRVLQGMAAMITASGSGLFGETSARSASKVPPVGADENLVSLVNLMQGTDSNWGFSRGGTLPLVARPFGMTHWSPQNKVPDGWFFDPNLHQIQGIRATHQPSPWMGDYGHFTVMAQAGDAALAPESRISSYQPQDMHIGPDSLSVLLARDGVHLEMTATERCAVFRFTFPAAANSRVILDADTRIEIDATHHTITGSSQMHYGGSDKAACYFHAEFDRPFVTAYPFKDGKPMQGQSTADGAQIGVAAEFGAAPTVTLRIGTSFISSDQARQNLQREVGGRSFDAVRQEAALDWEKTLGVVRIKGGTHEQRRTFYSCLYRAHLFPRMFHEHDAASKQIYYSPFDGQIHNGVMYTDTGLWDGYHTVYPLLSLLQPARLGEMMQGFINAYHEGGWLPQWPHPGYHGGMGGTHSDVVLADAILKDIPGFDREAALAAMWKNATVPPVHTGEGRGGLADYLSNGYLPVGSAGAVVSNSLDFAYDDACIALAAARLGHADKQLELDRRALNYRLLYDPSTGFMRAKNADGSWKSDFDEFAWGDAYTEGGPWQWSLSVPHDPAGLMTLMGGQAALVRKLDRMLWQPPMFHPGGYGHEIHEMTEMAAVRFGQYDQGNQPVHQVLAHYVAAGCPSRMQYWSRRVLDHLYTPESFPGDEDNGGMASWYVLASLGLFPHCPGRPSYVFASPLFPEAVITPPNGRPLTIHAPAASPDAVYVTRVVLNGHAQDRLWISHADLARGGRLEFMMATRPTPRRLAAEDLPPSLSAYHGMPAHTESVPVEIGINCGGSAADTFVGDCFVDGGQSIASAAGPAGIAQSERQGVFAYRIPLPMPPGGGAYILRLHFALRPSAGTMEVHVNHTLRLSAFRPTDTGSDGLTVIELADVLPGPDGEVLIEFAPTPGSPPAASGVSGIQILST
jgi:predicted alpha-1,2-mannosidase